ncbi:MAG: hypothetical protein M1831_005940 [Alyxoria varia]|nr:MAG: hypothetical protein M1831_005940 [Alyxoria varia]
MNDAPSAGNLSPERSPLQALPKSSPPQVPPPDQKSEALIYWTDVSRQLMPLEDVPDQDAIPSPDPKRAHQTDLATEAALSEFMRTVRYTALMNPDQETITMEYNYPGNSVGPKWRIYMVWANSVTNPVPFSGGVSPADRLVDDRLTRIITWNAQDPSGRFRAGSQSLNKWILMRMRHDQDNGLGGIVKSNGGGYAFGWRIWYSSRGDLGDYPEDWLMSLSDRRPEPRAVRIVKHFVLERSDWMNRVYGGK